jgi:hypothetical protein
LQPVQGKRRTTWTAPVRPLITALPLHPSTRDYAGRGRESAAAGSRSRRHIAAILSDLPVLPSNRSRARRALAGGPLLHLRHMWGALDRPDIRRLGLDCGRTSRPRHDPRRPRSDDSRNRDGILHAATDASGTTASLVATLRELENSSFR